MNPRTETLVALETVCKIELSEAALELNGS